MRGKALRAQRTRRARGAAFAESSRRAGAGVSCPAARLALVTDDALPDAPGDALDARLAALEARVAALEHERASRPAASPARPPALPSRTQRVAKRWPGLRLPEAASEDILGKLGVALLLVGVLFLLKWSVDQGWLTDAVRVSGAGALGLALLAGGVWLRASRPVLARLLSGGGVAALYGTLWTAAVLYPLLPAVVAFAGLAAVAGLGLALALRQADGALATVAAAGGLVTPLLLYRSPGALGLLAVYAAVVLGASGAVYARRGWPGLLAAMALGGWAVVLTAWLVEPGGPAATGRAAFTLLVGAAWAAAGLVPLARPALASPTLPFALRPVVWAPVLSALLVVPPLDAAWELPRVVAVGAAVLLAAGYAAWARVAQGVDGPRAAFVPAALAAAAVAVWGAGRLFDFAPPDARWLAAATAAGCAVVLVARHAKEREMDRAGHALALGGAAMLLVALWSAGGMPWEAAPRPDAALLGRVLSAVALGAGALGLVGVRSVRGGLARTVYLTAAHLAVLAALRIALRPLADGAALTSGAWGLFAIALVVVGLRRGDAVARSLGLGTIVATALKVLVVDLPDVPVVWRVVLFMGLGALLIGVSYAVPGLLRGRPATVDGEPEP